MLHFNRVDVSGARMIPANVIEALFAPLLDRDIDSRALQPVLDKIAELYGTAGLPLGRAFVPAQHITDGMLRIHVVEGYIGTIRVIAPNMRTKNLVQRMASVLKAQRPLTKAALERVILSIQDIPGMTLGSRFEAMDPNTGATKLVLDANVKPVTVGVSLDNRSGLAGLPTAPYVTTTLNNLIGSGDQIVLTALLSPKPKDDAFYGLSFSSLAGRDGLRLGVDGAWSQVLDTVSLPGIPIKSQSAQLDAKARYPLLRGQTQSLVLQTRIYVNSVRDSLPNRGVFARDSYLASEFAVDYSSIITPQFAIAMNIKANQGMTNLTDAPHTRLLTIPGFSKLRGEMRAVWQVHGNLIMNASVMGQYSPNALSAAEEVNFGASAYGRAFAPAEIMGDKGVGVSLTPEYKIALNDKWSISPFVTGDYAKVWNKRGDGQGTGELVSAGAGLKLAQNDWGAVSVEADKPLNRTPHDARGRDFHFFVTLEFRASQLMRAITGNP